MANIKKPRYAKAFGVKNNFYVDDIVYTTTFGKKNEGKLSKKTDRKDNVKSLDDSSFSLRSKSNKLSVSSNEFSNKEIRINNPIDNKKSDIIGINDKYEEIFFGQSYSKKDNIHIQIAYNILDMNKIMSLYYYNIVYALKNMVRDVDIDLDEDVIGNLNYKKPFEKYNPYLQTNRHFNHDDVIKFSISHPEGFFKFEKYGKSQYSYYPIFKEYDQLKKDTFENAAENYLIKERNKSNQKYNFNLLRILSFVRQNIAHVNKDVKNELFNLENNMDEELIKLVEDKFDEDIAKLKKDFNKNASKNLWIIGKILNKKPENLLNEYYRFTILKENKNIGINIKKIRETIFDEYCNGQDAFNIRNNEHDSYRRKINLIYDYLIYEFINKKTNENKNRIEEYVNQLRKTLSEDEKNKCYIKFASDFIAANHNLLKNGKDLVIDYIVESNDKKYKINSDYQVKFEESFTLYSKLIYLLTYFLESKEKNDLLTALINKFDNIGMLNKEYKEATHNDVEYVEDYSFFDKAGDISAELRIIKNLSHMEENLEKPSKSIYKDVFLSLGFNGKESEISEEIKKLEDEENGNHPIRNFLINNIIKSTRFKYVIKYSNPKNFRKFIECEKLIKSILYGLPENQLDRYYRLFDNNYNVDIKLKFNKLYEKLLEVNYENLYFNLNRCLINKDKNESKENTEKEKIKGLVRLYYTVIYLAIKNLVNINSIFVIGFECFERDYAILNFESKKYVYRENYEEQLSLLNIAINFYKTKNKHKYNDLSTFYLEFTKIQNIERIFSGLRNNIIHLNSVTNVTNYIGDVDLHMNDRSLIGNIVPVYYELYVYTLERLVLDDKNTQEDLKGKYLNCLIKYKTYNKDFLKIMLAPLAYNIARYKNLTIRDLFYDQFKIKEVNNEENTNN